MINNEAEFKEKYPYLDLIPTYKKKNGTQVYTIKGGPVSWSSEEFPLNEELFGASLERVNSERKVEKEFQKIYPYLHPSADNDGKIRSIWVERKGRDAEAMPSPKNRETWEYTEEEFVFLNEEARKANQEGWFFCTGCGVAKPDEEYSYFHFAGRYCLKCKEADLRAYREAINENYN